ncbi:ATP-dependent DNA helicase [Trichonephila clavipes]|nr:ATP-dependent DNA helicase [Trichonephila clavipes]
MRIEISLELWFQQDGATCHTARATINLLKYTFGDRLISRFGPVNWPPRSCDLTPLDYFLWGYVKSLVYADKPQTLDYLEDNIRRVIADIRPQMLEKVIENWTSRLGYIQASLTAKRNRRSTASYLSRHLSSATGTTVSRQTVYRRLGHIGLYVRRPYPYMITMNLDVEDGLVNGAIGTLKYIEYLTEDEQVTIYGTTEVDVEPQPSTSTRIRKRVRLWLEFPNPSMGQLCRVKVKPHVMCKRDVLDLKWTTIVTRAANIPLGGNIKCRRNQFLVVSASAITLHKSQSGTFDEVIFNYDKSQQIQLVYVALSKVTSIDGLYLTNDKDDFKFYHGRGSTAPTVKDIRDEYDRMANHRLPTLSMQARAFCKRDVLAERNEDQGGYLHQRRQLILIVSAFNAESLVAHAGDIESDNILMNSNYMVISETWMNCANTAMINGFELRASNNTAIEHRTHCPSTSSELPVRVSAAGGSAIYRNLQSSTNCNEIIVNANKSCGNSVLRKHNVGDICLVDVKVEDLTLFILGAVYIHPKASAEAVKLCLYQSLLPYSANLTKLIPNSQPDLETPIVLCSDFNCDPQQNSYLVEFMRNEFGLNYVQTSPTTLGNTTIDCTFTRNINVYIMPYVSYFTYHRPMLNKIVVEY